MKLSKIFFSTLLATATIAPLSAYADVHKYERAGVFNPRLNKNVDLHYEFVDSENEVGYKVVEQYYMDGCGVGFVKMERIPDPDAHLYRAISGIGCDAYGIGFSLDFKKGWFLTPGKTSGKYPTGAFLLKWAETNNKTPSFIKID